MKAPPWVAGLKEGGFKRLMIVSALLVCLYLLAAWGSTMIQPNCGYSYVLVMLASAAGFAATF